LEAKLGRKVHPTGFRLGIIKDWQARWYAEKNYKDQVHEDIRLRKMVRERLAEAAISLVEVERSANQVSVTIHTAKPGIVIGRGGQKVEELRQALERDLGKKVRLNIQEIRQPEMDAFLVARSVAEQLEKRVAYKRALKQSIMRTMRMGAKGVKIEVAGRLGGAEMKRREWDKSGRVPLQTLRADIDYGQTEAHTTFGLIGVKTWIYKGEILPPPKRVPVAAASAAVEIPADAPVAAPEAAPAAAA
jgi:small subunit ribosomal protein S3